MRRSGRTSPATARSPTAAGSPTDGSASPVSGSFSRRNFGSDDIEPEYDLGDRALDDDALEGLDPRHYSLWRERLGGTASFDYRLSENSTLTLTGIFSELADEENRPRLPRRSRTASSVRSQEPAGEGLKLFNLALAGDHLLPSGVGVDYRLTSSRSASATTTTGKPSSSRRTSTFAPDISDPDNIQANPTEARHRRHLRVRQHPHRRHDTKNRDLTAAAAVTIPYRLGRRAYGRFKFGAQVPGQGQVPGRHRERQRAGGRRRRHRARDRHRRAVRYGRLQPGRLSVPAATPPAATT